MNDKSIGIVYDAEYAADITLSGIGGRIKLLRRRMNMTQKELAGDKITRNMLSSIENGSALPSLSTLVYIAKKLNVPCACLLDDAVSQDHIKADLVRRAHEHMKQGEYATALELVNADADTCDDETALIRIECELALARELVTKHRYIDAAEKLQSAVNATDTTLYSTAGSGYIAELYLELAKRMLPFDKADDGTRPPNFDVYMDIYVYLRIMDLFDNGEIVKAVDLATLCEIKDRILSAHIAARLDLANGRYSEAAAKLRQICESEEKSPTPHGGLMLYRILDDLERCAKGENDYVLAYTYKEEKLKLYSAMSGIKL